MVPGVLCVPFVVVEAWVAAWVCSAMIRLWMSAMRCACASGLKFRT